MAGRDRGLGENALNCAIMQPTYLPWAGYFNLIASADIFVLLDDVQYERRSWQCRNRILFHGAIKMLEVPVVKQPLSEKIKNIVVDDEKGWRTEHLNALNSAYGAIQGGPLATRLLTEALADGTKLLSDINCDLITTICCLIGVRTPIVRASNLNCGGRRSDHLIEICRSIGATDYLSPVGARDYLEQDDFAGRSGIELRYQSFEPVPYPQIGAVDFVSHLSIIDIIANCGFDYARQYIQRK